MTVSFLDRPTDIVFVRPSRSVAPWRFSGSSNKRSRGSLSLRPNLIVRVRFRSPENALRGERTRANRASATFSPGSSDRGQTPWILSLLYRYIHRRISPRKPSIRNNYQYTYIYIYTRIEYQRTKCRYLHRRKKNLFSSFYESISRSGNGNVKILELSTMLKPKWYFIMKKKKIIMFIKNVTRPDRFTSSIRNFNIAAEIKHGLFFCYQHKKAL